MKFTLEQTDFWKKSVKIRKYPYGILTQIRINALYWFSYDQESGQISLPASRDFLWSYDWGNLPVDSLTFGSSPPMCMRISNPDMIYKQRVRIALCNTNDKNQIFDFVDGKIYSRENYRICAGYEYHKLLSAGPAVGTPLLFNTCYPNAWAITNANFNE